MAQLISVVTVCRVVEPPLRGADVEAAHKLGSEFNCKINLGLNLTVDWGLFNAGPLARAPC